jgi:RNA polymerase sigma-70 factor (ECF subfamily)
MYAAMEDYVDGHPRAFTRLYALLEPRLRGFLTKLVREPGIVDDLVQVALLKAHLARDRFELRGGDPDGAVQAWYFAIARNVAMDALRERYKAQLRREPESGAAADAIAGLAAEDADPERLAEATEDETAVIERVREAIARLPATQREVVELHKLRGMSMADVAARLRIREGAARVRAHRAYRALTRMLGTSRPTTWLLLWLALALAHAGPDATRDRGVHASRPRPPHGAQVVLASIVFAHDEDLVHRGGP